MPYNFKNFSRNDQDEYYNHPESVPEQLFYILIIHWNVKVSNKANPWGRQFWDRI